MPALVEDIPEPAAGWQGQAGNLLSRYFISSPWGLRGAGTGTKEQKQRQEGAQAPRSQHPAVSACLGPSTTIRASAQQSRTARRMNHLPTIPPKTTELRHQAQPD